MSSIVALRAFFSAEKTLGVLQQNSCLTKSNAFGFYVFIKIKNWNVNK